MNESSVNCENCDARIPSSVAQAYGGMCAICGSPDIPSGHVFIPKDSNMFGGLNNWQERQLQICDSLGSVGSDFVPKEVGAKLVFSEPATIEEIDEFNSSANFNLPTGLEAFYRNVSDGLKLDDNSGWFICKLDELTRQKEGKFNCSFEDFFSSPQWYPKANQSSKSGHLSLSKCGLIVFAGFSFCRYMMVVDGPLSGAVIQIYTNGTAQNRHLCEQGAPHATTLHVIKSIIIQGVNEFAC